MSAASVFKNFSNLGKKKKGKKKKPRPPPSAAPRYNPIWTRKWILFMTPEQVRSKLLLEIKLIMADFFAVNTSEPDLRHRFGVDRTVEIIRNNRMTFLSGHTHFSTTRNFFQNPSTDEFQLNDALIMILRKYIPDDTVIDLSNLKFENLTEGRQKKEVVRSILRNQQGNWLPRSVSSAMNEEIQAVTKKYSKQFQKQLLIEIFKKGKSQDGKWSMRRESAIRTLQNSEKMNEIIHRVNRPGGPGEEAARLSHAAAQAKQTSSSSSQGGRRRKKTRRKKKRKTKSRRRRKSKKRKTKSRKK